MQFIYALCQLLGGLVACVALVAIVVAVVQTSTIAEKIKYFRGFVKHTIVATVT